MFIKRVGELKSAGVWKEFSAPADLFLAPRTLVYGFNGSGKTTLSRVFSSIQRSELEERLPAETTFKVEASDGSTTTQKPISNLFGKNLLVFNTDFVSRNFEWDNSSTNGIAYLSEKKVEARKEFDELTPKVGAAQKATKAKEGKKGEAEKAFSAFKTRVARSIREVASSSAYTQSYDARKIQGHYSKASFGPEKALSQEDLKKTRHYFHRETPYLCCPSLQYFQTAWLTGSGQALVCFLNKFPPLLKVNLRRTRMRCDGWKRAFTIMKAKAYRIAYSVETLSPKNGAINSKRCLTSPGLKL